MVQNTKNTERELKIQKTPKFFVKYKRREKKYKKQLLPAAVGDWASVFSMEGTEH